MLTRIGLLLLALVTAGPASALEFEPGLWEVTLLTQSPMMGERRDTRTECITQSSYDPLKDFQADQNCEILEREESGKQLKWKMRCGPADGPQMVGEGKFVSRGQEGAGDMTMTMTFAGQTMVILNKWTGKRVGECD